MANYRQDRIEGEIRRELDAIIRTLKDPRLSGMISVVAVDVTRDLRYAKAYISVLGDETAQKNTIAALTAAAGFVRREMSGRVKLRCTPEFIFTLDTSIEYGAYMNQRIHDVLQGEQKTED